MISGDEITRSHGRTEQLSKSNFCRGRPKENGTGQSGQAQGGVLITKPLFHADSSH